MKLEINKYYKFLAYPPSSGMSIIVEGRVTDADSNFVTVNKIHYNLKYIFSIMEMNQ